MSKRTTIEPGAVVVFSQSPDELDVKTGAIVIVNEANQFGRPRYTAEEIIEVIGAARAAATIYQQPIVENPGDLQ